MFHVDRPFFRINGNNITIPQQGDVAANLSLRSDMADAQSAGAAAEAAIGDQARIIPLQCDVAWCGLIPGDAM